MAKFSDETIQRILRGRREFVRIKFPGEAKVEIALRILVDSEIDDARLEAAAYCRKRGVDLEKDPDFLDREVERQIVWRAIYDVDTLGSENPHPFFPSDGDVRGLDSTTVRALFEAYLAHQESLFPSIRLSEEEVADLVEALGKERTTEALLSGLEPVTLRACVRSLAFALRERRASGRSSTSSGSSSPSGSPLAEKSPSPPVDGAGVDRGA